MREFCLVILCGILICINCKNLDDNARFFGRTYTSTVVETKVVTSLIPSSCVRVDATLPPCRNVRYLRFPNFPALTFQNENSANQMVVAANATKESRIEQTSLTWGEYFGFYAPTVTITKTAISVTTVQDPAVIVTFSISGCRPLKLPLDLNRCPQEPSFFIEEILPTSTISSTTEATEDISPSKSMINSASSILYDNLVADSYPVQENLNNLVEPSTQSQGEEAHLQPTEALPVTAANNN